MNFDISGIAALLIQQIANLTREEQKKLAEHLGGAVATIVTSSRTRIDDVAVRSIAVPFAKDFIQTVEARL
jgi:hypothetical protein